MPENAATFSAAQNLTAASLNSELASYVNQIEAIKNDAAELLTGVTDAQFNQRPAPHAWSIAECLVHLNIVGRLYLPRVNQAVDEAKANGVYGEPPFRHNRLGNWFVRFNEPPPKLKLKAPKLFKPPATAAAAPDQLLAVIVGEFMQLQEDVIASIRNANRLDLARVKVASPISKLIKLSLGQALALTAAHERRHLWQARQVKSHPSFKQA